MFRNIYLLFNQLIKFISTLLSFFLIGISLFFSSVSYGQVKIKNLFFNSPTEIIRGQFSSSGIKLHNTDVSSGTTMGNSEGIAHVEDRQGNIIIWVNASGVYDKSGVLMPGSENIKAHPSSTEIVICPDPADTNRFYIVYNSQLCSSLYYSLVDMNLRGGLGGIADLNKPLSAGNDFAEGLEIVKIPCSKNYWLLSYQCYKGFVRFTIDENGINNPALIHTFTPSQYGGRGELDYQNGKIGYAATFTNKAFFSGFNPVSGTITNPQEVTFPATNGMYGLEFSPDANKAFITDWDNRDFLGNINSPNLFSYDFLSKKIESYTITNKGEECGSSDVRGLGQIELGSDGNLYIPHFGGCQITVIKNPGSSSPQFSLIDAGTILSSGISDHIQSNFLRPLTVTSDTEICPGDSLLLLAEGASNFTWKPEKGLSTPHESQTYAKPLKTTHYWVYSENEFGCKDSATVQVKVTSLDRPTVSGPSNFCPDDSVLLTVNKSFASYQWYKEEEMISGKTSNTLDVKHRGSYSVAAYNEQGCKTTSLPFKVSETEINKPEVFPSGDSTVCKGDEITISTFDNQNFKYQWYKDDNIISNENLSSTTINKEGNYYVVVSINSCKDSSSYFNLKVESFPEVELGEDRVVCFPEKATMEVNPGIDKVLWSTGSQSNKIDINQSGIYWVEARNGNCKSYDEVSIEVIDKTKLFVPNLITPNNDGKNDFFQTKNYKGEVKLTIFNRWGEKIFNSENYINNWGGNNLPEGVYYYNISDKNGCINNYKGWIQIVK